MLEDCYRSQLAVPLSNVLIVCVSRAVETQILTLPIRLPLKNYSSSLYVNLGEHMFMQPY